MAVYQNQKFSAYFFVNYFILNILHGHDFYMVERTVVDVMLTLPAAGIALTLMVFITACTEYNGSRTVDSDEKKLTCSL